ncbi:excalibur calcium-binding domain-containing protein [Arthrobacter luteolus]|uniref:excalibur calcium-binding domain-containing protein n=1 Tax=Arthrobacter luteolus TaxID=98672 RepID=UPI0008339FDB|nr:excalibur calcium-binding domain-containing protein [Arthrobacter luteolus]
MTSPSATEPSPSATPTSGSTVYVCTENENGRLVWLDKDSSEKLVAARQTEADKKAAEDAVAAAEAQRLADEAAAAQAAETQRLADEAAAAAAAAAAAEAQRLAEEQARQQYVAPAPAPAPAPANVYYANCSAARAAGAAPVYIGSPGYGKHLDRDGDGIGCE